MHADRTVVIGLLVGLLVLEANATSPQTLSPTQPGWATPGLAGEEEMERSAARQWALAPTVLSRLAAFLEPTLAQEAGPPDTQGEGLPLETVDIQKTTADYQHQLQPLQAEVLAQEQRNVQLRQDMAWLVSLTEKYASGEGVAKRLVLAFERLQRERRHDRGTPIKTGETRLRQLTSQMMTLDDQLYTFDRQAEIRLREWAAARAPGTPEQRQAARTSLRQTIDAQKAALHEQQQALTALVQETTRLLALHREYRQLLENSSRFIRTKMFWLRSADTLSWTSGPDVIRGAVATARLLQDVVHAEQTQLRASFAGAVQPWACTLLLFVVFPLMAYWGQQRLRNLVRVSLEASARHQEPPGMRSAILLLGASAIWPAYLVLLAWVQDELFSMQPHGVDLATALVSGLQVSALILWVGLLGRALLQGEGWGQHFWGLSPELCRFLRRLVTAGCLAALLLLVPYHILHAARADVAMTDQTLALARCLFLAFQIVLLVLVGLAGWRNSPLMAVALARSRQDDGLLWRLWPLVYVMLLGGVMGTLTLHVLGYLYATRYIWTRVLESLGVFLLVTCLLGVLVLRTLRRRLYQLFGARAGLRQHIEEMTAGRALNVVHLVGRVLLTLLTVGLILELWGISVTWLLTSPMTVQILRRVVVITLVVGLIIGVIQTSNIFTEYLLRPRTTRGGHRRTVGRKLRTLAPLTQTIIRVGAIFLGVLMILEQLSVATGPILAGVGLFGLAVGFASQSLIKDVINGLFLLFEDSLSVGDVVLLRGIGGQVEKVTLRAVTIRDLSGNVHFIPNSTIDMVTNMTKEYSCYVLDIRVAYHEDVDLIIGLLGEIDAEIRRDQDYSRDILEPLEVLGLERFDESAVVIRARLKTRPIEQWRIAREFNRRLKKVFDERGIEMPFPHRTLSWGPTQYAPRCPFSSMPPESPTEV